MANNFVLNYSFSRNLAIPIDEDAVKATLAEVRDYVENKSKCYEGQLFSVTGDTGNNGLYIVLSKGVDGVIIKLATQEALDAVAASAGKIDEIRLNGNALTINNKVVNIDLSNYATVVNVDSKIESAVTDTKAYVDTTLEDYATKSYVTDTVVGQLSGGTINIEGYAKVEDVKSMDANVLASAKTYTDEAIATVEDNLLWLPVEDNGEKHVVRHWKGSRANYEFLLKNNALDSWTKYVVVDTINDEEVILEYYGTNQVYDLTGQLLPVKSIIGSITEITASPYDRYLVGSNETGFKIYECVMDSENTLKWNIKTFDYRYGVRVIDKGLKNYVYINGALKTYDDVDCGEF